jgi:thiamine-monophosphate kinase
LALRRDGAKPGDSVYVTGTLGDAGLALAVAFGRVGEVGGYQDYLQMRLERPEPRIAQGLALREIASAAIDLSDGLAQDLGHILERSKVGARLDVDRLPLSPALLACLNQHTAITTALTSGDDYELCFMAPPERVERLEHLAMRWDCRCTRIGVITAESGLQLLRTDGSTFRLDRSGYDHFDQS